MLKFLKQDKDNRHKLKQLLILLCRILAITAVVLAFARPVFINKTQSNMTKGKSAVSVFVDNSFSMESKSSDISLLDEAKKHALEIVSSYGNDDVFQLLTCDFEGKHQQLVSKSDFEAMLDEVDYSPNFRSLNEIVSRQQDILNTAPNANHISFVISDFQKSTVNPDLKDIDSSLNLFLIQTKGNVIENISIDSCWFETPYLLPTTNTILKVKIGNYSDKKLEKIPIKLFLNGQQKAISSIDAEPKGSTVTEIPFSFGQAGNIHGVVEINDYPVTFDDKMFFTCNVKSAINVLSINEKEDNIFIKKLYEQDSSIMLNSQNINRLDYSAFSDYSLIILNEVTNLSSGLMQELKRFVDDGGSLVVFPSADIDTKSYSLFSMEMGVSQYERIDTAKINIDKLHKDAPIFRDVFSNKSESQQSKDLGIVTKRFVFRNSVSAGGNSLIDLADKSSFLIYHQKEAGSVYMFASPMNTAYTDFQQKAVFVPVMYNIALQSTFIGNIYNQIGDDKPNLVKNPSDKSQESIIIKSTDSDFYTIPQIAPYGKYLKLFTNNSIKKAGNYSVQYFKEEIGNIALNYNRIESNMELLSQSDLKQIIKISDSKKIKLLSSNSASIQETVSNAHLGFPVWKYLVIAALLMLLAEVLIIRFWK